MRAVRPRRLPFVYKVVLFIVLDTEDAELPICWY